MGLSCPKPACDRRVFAVGVQLITQLLDTMGLNFSEDLDVTPPPGL